jgi:hypothetical protein
MTHLTTCDAKLIMAESNVVVFVVCRDTSGVTRRAVYKRVAALNRKILRGTSLC